MMCIHAGTILCAKALQTIKAENQTKDQLNWITQNIMDGAIDSEWPERRPDTYRVADRDGVDEIRLCAGSPLGEVSFLSGELQRTVCIFLLFFPKCSNFFVYRCAFYTIAVYKAALS